MADIIDYQIFGDDLQLVEIELDPQEGVRAEIGTMTYMENGIEDLHRRRAAQRPETGHYRR